MKRTTSILLKGIFIFCFSFFSFSQEAEDTYNLKDHYTKEEKTVIMRDGVKLHTTIYAPKDTSKKYPILLYRTPYSSRPYGKDAFRKTVGPNQFLMKEGNIIVYQDVRGRWMSEGTYDNMRAYIPNKKGSQIDESSDTYDTVDWLVKNVANNNGRVGIWGISYPGFYATCSLLDTHPAVKAVSPQAPIGDFFFDDFHHNGAYILAYWRANAVFGIHKKENTTKAWYKMPEVTSKDQYDFFLEKGPLTSLDEYNKDNFFWEQLKDHPNYDTFWQSRGIVQHLENVKPAVMTVGGLFDAEDLYGPLETYKNVEKRSNNYNIMVFGPWGHGDWARKKGRQSIGNVYFGSGISEAYQKDVETKFFNHFLKGSGDKKLDLPEFKVFDTGKMAWNSYDVWPPKKAKKKSFYLSSNEELGTKSKKGSVEFVSDPKKPVPYSEDIKMNYSLRKYMTDDQRFAARRPDVMVFETPRLTEDITLVGEILAKLKVATTGTDADWVVKVIDVYPYDAQDTEETQKYLKMSNYHLLVRSEVMRGRFRNDFSKPEAFVPNKKTEVHIKLQDVHHTFKKGHKIQVQVQSTWFPLIDMNPQTFVPNIFKAKRSDYKKQTHTIFHDSKLEVLVLE
ncbi:X-Pro dipeptidyl-peptidase [Tenacibaculum sp. 190524A02b]|uniref:CocE/NonD family hydrolase n=1 Tax=Tenacibaculum vairaonense TaxID=3137860 RepID=UPI0032B273DA